MERLVFGLTAGLLLAACTSKVSGAPLWAQACEHALALSPGSETSLDECVASYRNYPASVSDDMARCVLRQDSLPTEEMLDGCLSEESKAIMVQLRQTDDAVSRHEAAVQAYEDKHGALPRTLAELGAGYDGRDAWRRPLLFKHITETEFSLCSAGYDGKPDNEDDQCQAFIYFQF